MFSACEHMDVRERRVFATGRRAYVDATTITYGRVGTGDNCADGREDGAVPAARILPGVWVAFPTPFTDVWSDDEHIGVRDVGLRGFSRDNDRQAYSDKS